MLAYKAKGDHGQKDLKFPCRLSGRLGKSSVILKDAHKSNIKHIKGKEGEREQKGKTPCVRRASNTNCLEKSLKAYGKIT